MVDPESPLVDYYPKDFEVDANGKTNSWECIVRIPFISEDKLIDAVCSIDHKNTLEDSERRRNLIGEEFSVKPTKPSPVDNRQRAAGTSNWGNALKDDYGRGGGRRDNSNYRRNREKPSSRASFSPRADGSGVKK